MADYDIVIRKYMEDKKRFSDLMNGRLFGGKQIVKEENQMNIHYAMPIRNMLYDALSYAEQVEQIRKEHERKGDKLLHVEFLSGMKKEDSVYPVVMVVIYYGEKEWDASLDLYGIMKIPKNINQVYS